jgi:hypothetical protein
MIRIHIFLCSGMTRWITRKGLLEVLALVTYDEVQQHIHFWMSHFYEGFTPLASNYWGYW